MKRILSSRLTLAAIMLVSCGGGKKSEPAAANSQPVVIKPKSSTVKPEMNAIQGPLRGCYEVVQKDYKFKKDYGRLVSIELKRTDKELPFDKKKATAASIYSVDGSTPIKVDFRVDFMDEDKTIVETYNACDYSSEDIIGILQLASGDTGIIRCKIYDDDIKPTSFRITSVVEDSSGGEISYLDDEDSSTESQTDLSDATSGSADWDKLLDSYEEYVDKYISFMSKAQNGDMNALTEYPALLEKAQELGNELSAAQGSLSASQLSRYLKITNKLTTISL